MRNKVVLSIIILAVLAVSGIGFFGVYNGQAEARAVCREQADESLKDTKILLAGNKRKMTLERVDDLFERLNEARACMSSGQKKETDALTRQLGQERAIILFQQPHCTAFDQPVEGCRSYGWPASRPVPRLRMVRNTGL